MDCTALSDCNMNPFFVFEHASQTDVGKLRDHNEDCIGYFPDQNLAILADGMGGHRAGEVASEIAVRTVRQVVCRRLAEAAGVPKELTIQDVCQLLADACWEAGTAILEQASLHAQQAGMGTTVVAAVFHADRIIVAHVGDSRAYRIRQGGIIQLTKDHSFVQQQVDSGLISPEEGRTSSMRHLLTRALGSNPVPEADVAVHDIQENDLILLCSDGLTDMLTDEEMLDAISTSTGLSASCQRLIDLANDAGGHDNVSVILIAARSEDGIPLLGEPVGP